jgi:hypothetical protein
MGPAGFEPATNQVKYIARMLPSGMFTTIPSRTVRATFIAHGSPTPTFHLAGDTSFNAHVRFSDFVVCTPSPCIGHYPDHLSTMGAPSPCISIAPRRVELRSIAYKAIALNRCATGPKMFRRSRFSRLPPVTGLGSPIVV